MFVEQPVAEVYAKLNASILRTGAAAARGPRRSRRWCALALARGMVRPIRTLEEGAQRIGAGDLDQKIDVRTGDELEGLADQFNRMTAQLRESYAGLERKVEERTQRAQELARAADGDQRDPARDLELADRRAAGAGRCRRARGAPVRRAVRARPARRRRRADVRWPSTRSAGSGRPDASRRAGSAQADVDHRPRRRSTGRPSTIADVAAAARHGVPGRDARTCCGSAAARCWRCR